MQGDSDGKALPLWILTLFFKAGASGSVHGRPSGALLSGPQDLPSLPHKATLPTYICLQLSLGRDR